MHRILAAASTAAGLLAASPAASQPVPVDASTAAVKVLEVDAGAREAQVRGPDGRRVTLDVSRTVALESLEEGGLVEVLWVQPTVIEVGRPSRAGEMEEEPAWIVPDDGSTGVEADTRRVFGWLKHFDPHAREVTVRVPDRPTRTYKLAEGVYGLEGFDPGDPVLLLVTEPVALGLP